jgi:TatD DNase family protein
VVDTHAHLGVCEPADGELVADARRSGVRRILTVGLDEASNREAIRAAVEHEEVFASVGRHPNSASGFDDAAAADIAELARHERVRAIGETGLDYYRDSSPREAQREAFAGQIAIARGTGLPLVIHLRDQPGTTDALDDAFATLSAEAAGVTVILHCCSVSPDRIGEAIERGWYCSFAGNVTYPKSDDLRETAVLVPDELLLAETDAPFLSPQERRGKPNEPAYVTATARFLAELRDTTPGEMEQLLDANAARLFDW